MAAEYAPTTILTPLYRALDSWGVLPGWISKSPSGENQFYLITFTWLGMIILATLAIIASRRLRKIPGRFQCAAEAIVGGLCNLLRSLIGPSGPKFLPLLGSLFIFIFVLNLMGIVPGFISPTSSWNCTVALALVTIVLVQWYGIRANGLAGHLKHFAGSPKGLVMWLMAPLMFPIHIVGELAKPLSLSLRLYGNIRGEKEIVLSLIDITRDIGIPLPIPLPMMAFAVFLGFLQAFIFTSLSCIYIMTVTAHDEGHEEH